jgi:hypothetical protein
VLCGPGVPMPCACSRLASGAGGVVVFAVWLGVGLGRRRACAGCSVRGTARIGGHGLACLVGEAGRVAGGGEAQHFRVESGCGSLPPLGHCLDAASADRDDRDTGQGGQGGVKDGVEDIWCDMELVDGSDDAESQNEASSPPAMSRGT